MTGNTQNSLPDGYLSMEGGVDSGLPPSLLQRNQLSWAVNTTVRDGWPEPRPGWYNREMDFQGSEPIRAGLEDGYFQGAGTYSSDDGRAFIAVSVSGRIFTIEVTDGFKVREITIPGDQNQANRPHAWFEQAENWLVVQNNLNPAFLYNGSGSRRAGPDEVPVGGPMAYGKGRLFVARGSLYYGGDIVFGDRAYGRNSVIRFTENTFLHEGGAFGVPNGPVSGLKFAANLDSSLGDGDLLAGSLNAIHAFAAPVDRDTWKDLQQPAQRIAARAFGPVNQESMVIVNGDVIFRAPDGIRSFQYSRRDFGMWGQTPISRQVQRALRYDTDAWLTEASGVNFDNRLLMTIQPQLDPAHGVWHRGLCVLDYNRVAGMGDQRPPVWEGIWTGLRILRILTIQIGSAIRCFIFALNEEKQIQLWEVTKDGRFDRNPDDVPIQWIVETRGMNSQKPTERKRLMGLVQWFDKLAGEVSLNAMYRADEGECWHPWSRWSDCAKYRDCEATGTCPDSPYTPAHVIRTNRPQFRSYIGLFQPPDVTEPQGGGLTRDGFEFQFRFECSGRFRLKRLVGLFDLIGSDPWGDLRQTTCGTTETGACADGSCGSVACCDRNDFGYIVESQDAVIPGYPTYPGYPGVPVPPGYPGYPGYPVFPGIPGEGGGDDGGGGGGDPTENPIYAPDNPGGPPPTTGCDGGELITVDSNYMWSFTAGQNPNELLTAAQVDCHVALFNKEKQALIDYYVGLGYTVTDASARKWVWFGNYGVFLAMFAKPTCDPFDGVGDHYVLFNGITTIQQIICVKPPS